MKFIGDVLGFQAKEACAFAGVGYKRLDNWAITGFIRPSLKGPGTGKRPFRYYSFHDLVAITVARKLRDTGFSLGALRRVGAMLEGAYHDPQFAHAWLISDGHDIFELRRTERDIFSLLKHPGQSCLPLTVLDLGRTFDELVDRVAQERHETQAEVRELIARGVERKAFACNADSVA